MSPSMRASRRVLQGPSRLLPAFIVAASISLPASAQQTDPLDIPHVIATDENGVDLVSANVQFTLTDLTIGAGGLSLTHTLMGRCNGAPVPDARDSFRGPNGISCGYGVVAFGACTQSAEAAGGISLGWGLRSECFIPQNGGWVPEVNRGSTLVSSNGLLIYTTETGEQATFDTTKNNQIIKLRHANGWTLDYHYVSNRLHTITTNNGLQIIYTYESNDNVSPGWTRVVRVTGVNNAYDYCAPTVTVCTTTRTYPTASYARATGSFTVTDYQGGVTRYTLDSRGRVTGVKPANSVSADVFSYTYCNPPGSTTGCRYYTPRGDEISATDKIVSATNNGRSFTYPILFLIGDRYNQVESIGPDSRALAMSYIGTPGVSFIQGIEHDGTRTNYELGGVRIQSHCEPRGNCIRYGYDARHNVTDAWQTAVPASGLADLHSSAGYPTSCTNQTICNKPLWVRDANGNQTDFTYDPNHGGVLTETRPAVNGVRPQRRYSYAQRYAWFKNSAGSYVRAATPIWLRTQEAFCRTSAATGNPAAPCATAGDEVRITYEYGPDSGPNNLFQRGQAIHADGQSLRTCYGYDAFGNRISETEPNAGLSTCP